MNRRAVLEKILPEICKPKDLVEAGLFENTLALNTARKRGQVPHEMRPEPNKILYLRADVIDWLLGKKKKTR